jgi:phosphatidate cytidylyltransferase
VLKTRLLTAAIALPILLAAIFFAPAWFFTVFIGTLGIIGLYEVGAMTHARSFRGISILIFLGVIPMFAFLVGGDPGMWVPIIVALLMLILIAKVATSAASQPIVADSAALTAIGAPYVGVLYPYFAMLRNRAGGITLIVLMLMLAIASDSGAYFVGRSFGRNKLAPKVSPNKTIEGALGGLLATVAAGLILRPFLESAWSIIGTAAMAAIVSVLAQVGDLAGSALKRAAGVKDSGWIFPGHGGLIDRTCSLVFAAVFTYYWVK